MKSEIVSPSFRARHLFLNASLAELSVVRAKRVPICTPSAPGCIDPAPINPNPPALLTAEANRHPLHHAIPPRIIGYWM